MSGVGFWELVILLLIGLVVLGPERLPRVANQLGTWLGQARRMTRVMKRQLEEELNLERGEHSIRPARLQPPPAPAPAPAPSPSPAGQEYDDKYSPAHPADSVGTGVGTDAPHVDHGEVVEDPPDDAAVQESTGDSGTTRST